MATSATAITVESVPAEITWRAGAFFHREGERVVCDLCPFRCALVEGETGRCAVRRARGGQMETATFASALQHLDPIERKPLYHFRPGSQVVTLAAPGCNWRCLYCQNYRLSQFGRDEAAPWSGLAIDPAQVAPAAAAAGAALGLSYSEPGLAAELWLALVDAARPLGLDLVWKSNGFLTPTAARRLGADLSAANIDLKSANPRRHRALTGGEVGPVLETLEILLASGVWIEVSTPLIPGVNTSDAELQAIAERLAGLGPGIPWHLMRFVPEYRLSRLAPTSLETLHRAVEIGRDAGLRFIYTERMLGAAGRCTRCPGCGTVLVERRLYGLDAHRITNGTCPDCGYLLPGVWSTKGVAKMHAIE